MNERFSEFLDNLKTDFANQDKLSSWCPMRQPIVVCFHNTPDDMVDDCDDCDDEIPEMEFDKSEYYQERYGDL